MAVWSVIPKTQLEGATRLDSEYYQPEYLTLMESLRKKPTVQLNSIAFAAKKRDRHIIQRAEGGRV